MTFLIVFMLMAAAIFGGLGFMDQRALYQRTVAWQYRNPEAHEPSDAALAVGRVALFLGAGVLVVMAIVVGSVRAEATYDQSEVRSVADSAAVDLQSGSAGRRSPMSVQSDVYAAVREAGGDRVKIESSGLHSYEITNADGDHPVCLTVTTESDLALGSDQPWSTTVETTVSDGPCG